MSEHLAVEFSCQYPTCTNIAAAVGLITSGLPHPDDQFLQRDILESFQPGSAGQISLKGFLQDYRIRRITNWSMPLTPDTYQRVAAALRSNDPAALYALDKEYAPFYCTHCHDCFCALHYKLEEVWDEAGLDYWRGACPHGHRKFIDH